MDTTTATKNQKKWRYLFCPRFPPPFLRSFGRRWHIKSFIRHCQVTSSSFPSSPFTFSLLFSFSLVSSLTNQPEGVFLLLEDKFRMRNTPRERESEITNNDFVMFSILLLLIIGRRSNIVGYLFVYVGALGAKRIGSSVGRCFFFFIV